MLEKSYSMVKGVIYYLVPGSEKKFIEKSKGLNADTIVMDLEDGVSVNKKHEARKLVYEALNVNL